MYNSRTSEGSEAKCPMAWAYKGAKVEGAYGAPYSERHDHEKEDRFELYRSFFEGFYTDLPGELLAPDEAFGAGVAGQTFEMARRVGLAMTAVLEEGEYRYAKLIRLAAEDSSMFNTRLAQRADNDETLAEVRLIVGTARLLELHQLGVRDCYRGVWGVTKCLEKQLPNRSAADRHAIRRRSAPSVGFRLAANLHKDTDSSVWKRLGKALPPELLELRGPGGREVVALKEDWAELLGLDRVPVQTDNHICPGIHAGIETTWQAIAEIYRYCEERQGVVSVSS